MLPFVPALESEIASHLAALKTGIRVEVVKVDQAVASLLTLTAFIDAFLASLVRWVIGSIRVMRLVS
jgi:hypothetical protein